MAILVKVSGQANAVASLGDFLLGLVMCSALLLTIHLKIEEYLATATLSRAMYLLPLFLLLSTRSMTGLLRPFFRTTFIVRSMAALI